MAPVVYRACKPCMLCKTCFYYTSNLLTICQFRIKCCTSLELGKRFAHSHDCLQHLSISATIRLGIYLLIDVRIKIDLGVLRLCGYR